MIIGALVASFLGPNPCDIDGNARSLEDLGKGRAARLRMERVERQAREDTRIS
jgi:hypothetical protein